MDAKEIGKQIAEALSRSPSYSGKVTWVRVTEVLIPLLESVAEENVSDGNSVLLEVEEDSASCPNGGYKYTFGYDTTGDGVVDEVVEETVICDGETGPQGPQGETGPEGPQGPEGPAGEDGEDGNPLLSETSPAPSGACPEGGIEVTVGYDTTGDGVIDDVVESYVICDGETGPEGPQGETGPEGPAGEDGEDGEDAGTYGENPDWSRTILASEGHTTGRIGPTSGGYSLPMAELEADSNQYWKHYSPSMENFDGDPSSDAITLNIWMTTPPGISGASLNGTLLVTIYGGSDGSSFPDLETSYDFSFSLEELVLYKHSLPLEAPLFFEFDINLVKTEVLSTSEPHPVGIIKVDYVYEGLWLVPPE